MVYSKYTYNTAAFTSNNSVSYYLLGCYLTDGSISKTAFDLSSKDKDWLEIIAKIISPTKLVETASNNCWRFRCCNKLMSEWLRSNNCIERKSLILTFPKIPKQFLADLMRGLIDGDGSISTSRNTVYFCTASEIFAKQFMNVLDERNIKYSAKERIKGEVIIRGQITIRKSNLFKISIWGKDCYKLLKWLYPNNDVLCMPRKHSLVKTIIDTFEARGLSLSNIDAFDTDKNRDSTKMIMTNEELLSIWNTWFSIPEDERKSIGSKKQFYEEHIKDKFDVNPHYINRLLDGKQRQELFKFFQKKRCLP